MFEFHRHSGTSDCLGLAKRLKQCSTVMSLILHLSHTFISGLFVMSWRRRDQTILVSTAVSQKLCACVRAQRWGTGEIITAY